MSANQRGWCSRRECPCWRQSKSACSQWEGYSASWRGTYQGHYVKSDMETWPFKFCPCCGLEKKDHRPLIHKGGKPRA
jgi:hypothetical protein